MKNVRFLSLISLIALSSCKEFTPDQGEKCSIKISDIEFTKSLNKANETTTVEKEKLVIRSDAKRDNFNEPDGSLSNNTAPVLLTKVDNTKPFTVISKVTPTFLETYDAGALYVYINSKRWVKYAFERDERKLTRIVTVRTIDTSDDNNHDVIDSTSVYMKISSDVKTIGYYYSLDKEKWQLVRLYKNDYPSEIWIGLSAQSPLGNGTSVTFEDCSLTKIAVKDFRMGI